MHKYKLNQLFTVILYSLHAASLRAAPVLPSKPSVYTDPIKVQTLSDRLVYPAAVSASRIVPVTSEVDGFIKDLKAELGQKVAQGSPLLKISNPDPVYHYEPFVVTAPFAGVITSIDIAVGDRVQKGRALLTLTDNRQLKIKINVTADDLSRLSPQQKAELKIGENTWPLHVRALSPMVDPATGTAACELELDAKANPSQLVAGKLGQVVFSLGERKGIIVPESAIFYRGRDTFVIRVEASSKAHYVQVKIAKAISGSYEILSPDLKEGQKIVTHATSYVAEGDELDVKSAEAGT